MIVDVIDVDRMSALEPEGHSPVTGHCDGVMVFQFALQRVKPKPRKIHILRTTASVEHSQDVSEFLDMLRRHPPRRSSIVEGL
jgi:hypothetical protein